VSVDRAEVGRIAALARLRLETDEAARLTHEMNRILEHVDRLQEAAEATGAPEAGAGGAASASLDTGERDEGGEGGRAAPLRGVRAPEAEHPDGLASALSDFAPRVEEGFLVVPPPHGVTAEGPAGP
jgi:Asp-tRNA(Asn)/Glu-tRNA(Gln) amidotransferase C subunit